MKEMAKLKYRCTGIIILMCCPQYVSGQDYSEYIVCALQEVVTNTHYSMKCNTHTCMCVETRISNCLHMSSSNPHNLQPCNQSVTINQVCLYVYHQCGANSLINNKRMKSFEARKHLSKRQNTESTKRT
jgi:hypothetical protein